MLSLKKPYKRPKLTLKRLRAGWWALYNPKGQEMCEPRIFKNRWEAEYWARSYISTWPEWELEIDHGDDKQQTDPVPEPLD